jgi:hypothetical protein
VKKKVMSKEKAAHALVLLAEEHLKSFSSHERETRIKAFVIKVSELKRKRASSSISGF